MDIENICDKSFVVVIKVGTYSSKILFISGVKKLLLPSCDSFAAY